MSFASPRLIFLVLAWASLLSANSEARELRVCADPNNLPFSNARGEGFENEIAELIAKELGAKLSYVWWAQRRGFIRSTLNAGICDLVIGSALGVEMLRSTRPYYRSSYMFVTRRDGPQVVSLDDPMLRNLRVGIQLIGNNSDNPPPAEALATRGIVTNVRGYPVYGDDRDANPGATIVLAVARGEIDVALVWGPLAGYYAAREPIPLKLIPVEPQIDGPRRPMVFDISMGVRKSDDALNNDINRALVELHPDIDSILASYHVPRLDNGAYIPSGAPR
jgi:mxaJ protein